MSERPIDAVIDHAAALQQQVDRLSREVLIVMAAVFWLAVATLLLSYRLWRADA